MPTWTKMQRRVIEARNTSLLVSAGAGAGKTAVLVERVIGRILDKTEPVDVDRLLVVTFTNAAAAEMRERIAHALQQELAKDPQSDRLRRQVTLLGRATITTLHSFCLEILRQNFHLLGLDPTFRVADETECALMQADVLETVLEENYRTLDATFAALVDGFGGRVSDEGLGRLILELASFALSQPDLRQWLRSVVASLAVTTMTDVEQKPWYRGARHMVRCKLDFAREALERALAIAETGPTHYRDVLTAELQAVSDLARLAAENATWDELRRAVASMTFGRLPAKRGYDAPDKEVCKSWRDEVKETIKELLTGYLAQSEDELVAGLSLAHPQAAKLIELTTAYLDSYSNAKHDKGIVDFNDLEHFALQVLSPSAEPSAVAQELQTRFIEVLVDEYQDINAVQEAILNCVARPSNRVMVGDVKQSIYRFRLADPGLFRAKERDYRRRRKGRCLYLAQNFRSRPSIIAAVNFLFSRLMTVDSIGEVKYDRRAALVAAAEYPAGERTLNPAVEVCWLERNSLDSPEGERDATTREAGVIAEHILGLVENAGREVWDTAAKAYRPLQYRDMVVLLRAAAGRADVFLDVFSRRNIPAYADAAGGYFRATEVHVLLSLLKLIDNPRQDIPLAGVLRSPLVGLSAQELADIRLAHTAAGYWDAVLARADSSEKLQVFLGRLERWRDMARRGGLPELIGQIYRDTGYYLYVGTLPGGRQRQANLRALLDRAHQFETTAYKGLFRFLRFIERLEEQEGDLGKPNTCGENDNVVRVVSIHKSKGLEFPVVFVAGLGNRFNRRDLNAPVLVHKELGIGPKLVDSEARCLYPSLPHLYLRDVLRRESLSEELRVLYVAFTRAREKLYLVGSVSKRDEKIREWRETAKDLPNGRLPAHIMEGAITPCDWLGPALYGHKSLGGTRRDTQGASFLEHLGAPSGVLVAKSDSPSSLLLAAATQQTPAPEGSFAEEVRRRLSYRYPYAASTQLPAKLSVSDIKRRLLEDEAESGTAPVRLRRARQQLPVAPAELTAAEIGSAMHMLLQHVDLSIKHTPGYFESLRAELVKRHLLTPNEALSFSLAPIAAFFASSLGRRLLSSPRVWRELPFSWRIAAAELYPAVGDEHVYVQGVIDCLFSEGDALILVDYKSDRVTEDTVAQACVGYRAQVDLYARAVEAQLKRKVAERHIYFFALGRGIEV